MATSPAEAAGLVEGGIGSSQAAAVDDAVFGAALDDAVFGAAAGPEDPDGAESVSGFRWRPGPDGALVSPASS